MNTLVKRWPLVVFFVLAVLIGVLVQWARAQLDPNVLGDGLRDVMQRGWPPNVLTVLPFMWSRPVALTGFLFPAAPTIAAIIVVTVIAGRRGVWEVLARFKPWHGIPWQRGLAVYLTCFGIFFSAVAFLLIQFQVSGQEQAFEFVMNQYGGTIPLLILSLLIAPFLDVGALFEEFGWRGFALPLLLQKLETPLTAAIVLGLMWAAWHMPRDITQLIQGREFTDWLQFVIPWTIGVVSGTIIMVFVYHLLGGSALAGVLIHGMNNTIAVGVKLYADTNVEYYGIRVDYTDLVEAGIAALVIAVSGRQLGRQWSGLS